MKCLMYVCVLALLVSVVPATSAQQVVEFNGHEYEMIGIQPNQLTNNSVEPDVTRIGLVPTIQATEAMRNNPARSGVSPQAICKNGFGIDYHCGPVMNQGINTYVFVYNDGTTFNWPIITNFLGNVGGTPYFNINTSYDDGNGNNILNFVSYVSPALSYVNPYPRGFNLSFNDIVGIVNDAVNSGNWGDYDPRGIYLVLTDPLVSQSNGAGGNFCTQYCGWHSSFPSPRDGSPIAFGFIGDPVLQCPGACEPFGGGNAPNGDEGADAMASVTAHELDEATTDPDTVGGWYAGDTAHENGDLCNFNFGPTYVTGNGSQANQNFAGADYLIQQNWLNAQGGGCVQSW